MKLGIMVILILSGVASANAARPGTTLDPLQYAESISKRYAEGDSGEPSGWEGCQFVTYNPEDPLLYVECQGTAELLMHGGHWTSSNYSCEFSFEEDTLGPSGFFINTESCYYF